MEDSDDDFGDLYADVEAQASSAINGVPGFAPFLSEPIESIGNARVESKVHGNPCSGDEDGNKSESEDDLNIVLNDEDFKSKSFAVEGRESAKSDENCRESDEDDGEDDFSAINELKRVGTHGSSNPSSMKPNMCNAIVETSGWNHNNVRNQCKGSISGQGALVSGMRNFGTSQRKYGFSLPRYRSILDVNIDALEEKPWNHPGVDITDFFNFGFNEDSWKQYCNSVDQFRLSEFIRLGNPKHVSQNQAKGRAIQVEDSIGERLPTVNGWRPRDRDSDVVIQINLEDTSDSGEKLDQSGGSPGMEPSDGELDSSDYRRDFHLCNNGSEVEFSMQSLKDIDKRMDRCSAKTKASNLITVDPTDTGENQSHDIDKNHHKKSFSSDERIARDNNVINACCANQSMVDTELSLEEEGQLSLASSCFDSDSEASGDNSHPDPGKITSPVSRSSVNLGAELCGSDASHQKNLKGNCAKIRPFDHRDYSKCKSPVNFEGKHRIRSVDYHGSDAKNMYDRDRLAVNYGRWKEKQQDVGYRDREDLACHEQSEFSTGYGGREFAKKHLHSGWKSYRKGSFHQERDSYLREGWNERRHPYKDEREEGYWYRPAPSNQNVKHVAYEKTYSQSSRNNNRFQSRNSTNYGSQFLDCKLADADFTQERYARSNSLIEQSRDFPDECYNRRLIKYDNRFPRRKAYNNYSLLEQEGSWSGKVEDEYWVNIDVSYLSHQSDRIEDEYWANEDAHYSSHQFYRESGGGRWAGHISLKNCVSRSRSRYRRQSPGEDEERGWFDDHNDHNNFEDGFIHPDDQGHFRRKRRFGGKSEVLPLTKEPIIRHQYEKLHFERSSFSSKRDQRHRRDYSSHESLHDEMHMNYMHSDRHGYKNIGDGINCQPIYKTNKMCIVTNEQPFLECRDSVDLFIEEGKLSGRSHGDRNSRFNSKVKDADLGNADERITSMDLDESPRYKAVQSNLSKVGCDGENEKFNERFPVLVQDDNIEIEEGQILAEEPCTRPTERIIEDPMHGHNVKKRMLHDDSASCGSKAGGACNDNRRILETLAKMEKRRERFKEPIITLKKEEDKCPKPDTVPVTVDQLHTKQRRPARKRQWCVR